MFMLGCILDLFNGDTMLITLCYLVTYTCIYTITHLTIIHHILDIINNIHFLDKLLNNRRETVSHSMF